MPSTDSAPDVVLVHDSPLGTLAIPTPDGRLFIAQRGEPVALPADVAGEEPGDWTPLADGETPDLDDGRMYMIAESGIWHVREPGRGLLAAEYVWRRASAPAPTAPATPATPVVLDEQED